MYALNERGLKADRQRLFPVNYRGIRIDCGYRIDLLVEDQVIVELKAVDQVLPIHEAQLLSYVKLSGCKVGLLINFKVKLLKDGGRQLRRLTCAKIPLLSVISVVSVVRFSELA